MSKMNIDQVRWFVSTVHRGGAPAWPAPPGKCRRAAGPHFAVLGARRAYWRGTRQRDLWGIHAIHVRGSKHVIM